MSNTPSTGLPLLLLPLLLLPLLLLLLQMSATAASNRMLLLLLVQPQHKLLLPLLLLFSRAVLFLAASRGRFHLLHQFTTVAPALHHTRPALQPRCCHCCYSTS
jgi:hypothetical protein